MAVEVSPANEFFQKHFCNEIHVINVMHVNWSNFLIPKKTKYDKHVYTSDTQPLIRNRIVQIFFFHFVCCNSGEINVVTVDGEK